MESEKSVEGTVQLYLRVTPELHKRLRRAAFEDETTMNNFCISAIEEYLNIDEYIQSREGEVTEG